MASLVIGALRVDLAMNSAAFEAGSKRARSSLGKISKAAAAAGAAIGVAMTAMAASVATSVARTVREADKIAKVADKVGLGVEELQKLRFAADLAGVGSNTLDMAMQRLSRRVGEAVQGTGELKGTLDQYGIAVVDADGKSRDLESVLDDIADAIKNAGSEQERLRIAFKAFDSEGAALVNMLRRGSAGLAAMRKEADGLGFIIDEKTARAAERLNDNMARLGKVWDGLIFKLAEHVTPALVDLTDEFVEFLNEADNREQVIDALGDTLLVAAESATALAEAVAAVNRAFEEGKAGNPVLWGQKIGEAIRGAFSRQFLGVDPRVAGSKGTSMSGASSGASGSIGFGDVEDPDKTKAKTLDELRAAADAAADALARKQAIEAAGLALMEQMRTPQEAYTAHLADLRKLLAEGVIDAQTFERAQAMAAGGVASHYASVAAAAGSALGSLFEDNKTVATANAIINTLEGVTAALKLPFPLNWAQAGAVAAAGYAQVAKIRSTSQGSRSGGSAPSRGGGGGGNGAVRSAVPQSNPSTPDSGRVPADPRAPRAPDQTFALRGIDPKQLYSGENVRDLIEAINAAGQDGYRIVIV